MDELTKLPANFTRKLTVAGECWLWQGGTSGDGYGRFKHRRRMVSAHRFAYEEIVGAIPEGAQLDHLCRNRGCCNPRHLEPVSCQVNLLRGETLAAINRAKTHCDSGHEFTPENTYHRPDRRGVRACRTCQNIASREYQRRRRAKRASTQEQAA